jgi:hypothetical protein
MSALHQETGAAQRERLLDLLEDDRLRQEVTLTPVAGAPVERAEVAVGDADVRVVQVAVDDEGDAGRVDLAVAEYVRSASDGDEIPRVEQRDRVVVRDPLPVERLGEDFRDAQVTPPSRCLAPGLPERDARRRRNDMRQAVVLWTIRDTSVTVTGTETWR